MDSKENNQFYIKYRYSNSKNKKDIPSIDMDFDPLNEEAKSEIVLKNK